MIPIYQEFLADNTVNELAAFDPSERLRYAVHEIVMRLKAEGTIKFGALSKILKEEFKVDISEELLKDILVAWDRYNDPDYSIFKKEDKNWMDVWEFQGNVKRKLRDKQSFGKHRNKNTTTTTYSNGYYDANNKWHYYGRRADDRFNNPYDNMWFGE